MFLRITRAKPSPQLRREAEETMRELVALYMRDESCLFQGSTGVSPDGVLVKIGLWQDRGAADAAAQQPRSLVLRSQLIVLCAERPVEEAYDLSGGVRDTLKMESPSPGSRNRHGNIVRTAEVAPTASQSSG